MYVVPSRLVARPCANGRGQDGLNAASPEMLAHPVQVLGNPARMRLGVLREHQERNKSFGSPARFVHSTQSTISSPGAPGIVASARQRGSLTRTANP